MLIAPDEAPVNFSPTIQSVIFPEGPVKDAKVAWGADGSFVSLDS